MDVKQTTDMYRCIHFKCLSFIEQTLFNAHNVASATPNLHTTSLSTYDHFHGMITYVTLQVSRSLNVQI